MNGIFHHPAFLFHSLQWRHGKRHGQGKYTGVNGISYEGGYDDDKHHGMGSFSWGEGRAVYTGQYR
jgi:hypothetical protein